MLHDDIINTSMALARMSWDIFRTVTIFITQQILFYGTSKCLSDFAAPTNYTNDDMFIFSY